jgi:hypothetical protein
LFLKNGGDSGRSVWTKYLFAVVVQIKFGNICSSAKNDFGLWRVGKNYIKIAFAVFLNGVVLGGKSFDVVTFGNNSLNVVVKNFEENCFGLRDEEGRF